MPKGIDRQLADEHAPHPAPHEAALWGVRFGPPRARLFSPEARPRELEVRLVADSSVGSAT